MIVCCLFHALKEEFEKHHTYKRHDCISYLFFIFLSMKEVADNRLSLLSSLTLSSLYVSDLIGPEGVHRHSGSIDLVVCFRILNLFHKILADFMKEFFHPRL